MSESIVAAAKRGDPIEAGRLLMDAARCGRSPAQEDFEAVVIGCAYVGDIDRAESWLHLLRLAGVVVSHGLVRSMMKTLSTRRRVEAWPLSVRGVSRWFLRLYFENRLPLSPAAVRYMLGHLARNGEAEEAELWAQSVTQRGQELTCEMMDLVYEAYVNAGEDDDAMQWAHMASSRRLRDIGSG